MDLPDLRAQIAAASDAALAQELTEAYAELKNRYFRGDFRPGQLEGGRFTEAAFRILQLKATGCYTPIGKSLPKVADLMQTLQSADASKVHESIRLHIPRALAAVYNVRNRRDVGHIAADVDANLMDATYVVATCDWVLAEFLRLFHQCSAEQAQAYVEAVVKRRAPFIQVFGETPFVLRSHLSAKDEILVLLWERASLGASLDELDGWLPTVARKVICSRVSDLERQLRYVRRLNRRIYITDTGMAYVESRILPSAAP